MPSVAQFLFKAGVVFLIRFIVAHMFYMVKGQVSSAYAKATADKEAGGQLSDNHSLK